MVLVHRAAVLGLTLVLLAAPLSGCMEAVSQFRSQLFGETAGVGERARDFITDERYTELVIEIDHVPGAGPHPEAVDKLRSAARDHLAKNDVRVTTSSEIPGKGENHGYTLEEIARLEREHRDRQAQGQTVALYIVYVEGGSARDTDEGSKLGITYRGSSIVMFKGNLREASCDSCGLTSTKPRLKYIERAVAVHELGHVLGLVNIGIPMQTDHEDDNHPGHSEFEESVMYWAIESSNINNLFSDGQNIPYQFDQYDRQDIRAVREGGA